MAQTLYQGKKGIYTIKRIKTQLKSLKTGVYFTVWNSSSYIYF